jgi:hypothetical protein
MLPVGICMMILLLGSLAIFWKKIKIRTMSSVQPGQHPHQQQQQQQQQGFNNQAGNDTILNVIGIIYVTIVLALILVPSILAAQKIIPSHPLFMVNTVYGLIYVPSLVIPITFTIIRPKSIKIGIQALPCCN